MILNRYRLAAGLHWPAARVPVPWSRIARDLLVVGALVLVYGLVDAIDNLAERAVEIEQRAAMAERAAEIYGARAAVLRDCEKGATGYYYPADGRTYEGSKPL
jgi:hypothetical protein